MENRDILRRLESLHYSLDQLVVVVAGIQGVDLLLVLNNNSQDSDIERGVQRGRGARRGLQPLPGWGNGR